MECATKLPEGDQKASEVKTVKTISGNLVVVLECHEIKEYGCPTGTACLASTQAMRGMRRPDPGE